MDKVAQPLLEDEVWGRTIWELAGNVAGSLRTPELSAATVPNVVYETATDMLRGRSNGFFPITERPATGATYRITTAFLAGMVRGDLTTATNERPPHRFPLLEVDGTEFSKKCVVSMVPNWNHTSRRKPD